MLVLTLLENVISLDYRRAAVCSLVPSLSAALLLRRCLRPLIVGCLFFLLFFFGVFSAALPLRAVMGKHFMTITVIRCRKQ